MHLVKPLIDPILLAADKAYQLVVRLGLSPTEAERALKIAASVAEERNTLSARNNFAAAQASERIAELQEKYGDEWAAHIFDSD